MLKNTDYQITPFDRNDQNAGEVIVKPESAASQIRILKSKDPSDSKIMKSKDSDVPAHLKKSKTSETDKPNETKPIRTKIVQSPNDMSDVLFVLTEGPSQLDRFPRCHEYLKERKSLLKNVRVANTEADEFAIFPAGRNVVVPNMLSKKHNSKVLSEGHDRLWTLLGAMPGLDEYIRDEQSRNIHRAWVFIVKDSRTTIHYSKMQNFISNLDQEKTNSFIGRGLKDNLDTGMKIIHHYDNSQMVWPDIQAGVLMSTDLVQKLAEKIRTAPPKMAFTIDAPYELARFLREELNVDLQSSEVFCYPDEADATGNPSGSRDSVSEDAIMYAVKTHTANHYTRVETIKKTWVQDAKHITFYSDQADEKVPTKETKGVPNTKRGHCGKLEYILRDLWENRADFKWFAVVDDDTSISPKRLARLLHKYTTTGSESVIIGEKYGFMFNQPQYGYEYPTLGMLR
ncbi:hypothetical protein, variant [Sphaeroforma arctica JP610]|uniref:N-acetylgalactosaminide beta-1,3-galactosyltransferase n=1 Tax=Sphaeroforma arctica JP610 TaxID=667725 RepID=A0A0L0G486_9EUKA|nr:hypothetical protein, variant [Sphaeroforma arctica JP610]KNC83621.1 hypothetical protein, variant [Sphaeroforma arctica JP610]|eukprot:XP_014157524.1 hypothetical protein, variant [Sphaeroforma arctica JP610]